VSVMVCLCINTTCKKAFSDFDVTWDVSYGLVEWNVKFPMAHVVPITFNKN